MAGNNVACSAIREFDAKLPEELSCYLNKIVFLPLTNDICLLDRENAKLKRFSMLGDIKGSLSLIDVPHSMCCMRENGNIVITKPDKSILEIVETSREKFNIQRYIQTDKKYFGICQVAEDKVAVSSWSQSCIDIMSVNGVVEVSVSTETLFATPESVPNMLCFTSDGHVVVTAVKDTICCISQDGREIWKLSINGHIGDIACDQKSQTLYIVLKDEGSVLRVNELGVVMSPMLKFTNNTPISIDVNKEDICVTDKNAKVIVYETN